MTGSKISVITDDLCAADIVKSHYRTASVFKKYGIEYCCGGKWPLKLVCETQSIDCEKLMNELQEVSRLVFVPASLPYNEWKTEFLTDYIINVHHRYLRDSLPQIRDQISRFVDEHKKKYPQLAEFIVLFPGPHHPGSSFNLAYLVERNPFLSTPFRIIVKAIESLGQIDRSVDIQDIVLAVFSNRKISVFSRGRHKPTFRHGMRLFDENRWSLAPEEPLFLFLASFNRARQACYEEKQKHHF